MKKTKLITTHKKSLADTLTPVSIYLKLRDKFANTILLESSDYHGKQNRFSYICCIPIASYEVKDEIIRTEITGSAETAPIKERKQVIESLTDFMQSFESEQQPYEFISNGAFGFISYDAVRYFEEVDIEKVNNDLPDIHYKVFQIVIAVDQFKNELYIFENRPEGEKESRLQVIEDHLKNKSFPSFQFAKSGEETTNYSDEEFMDIISKGRDHCFRGDVFQIVVSRKFQQRFKGDEFNVYRSLRSINPSPYLFYFDFGNYRLFGSSPEAQIDIKAQKASIYPIAGTFRRTGDDEADRELATQLSNDPKENSEHVMLVDLARNDLSIHGENVEVEVFKEVQFYSHVIHLVSKVSASIPSGHKTLQLAADTFPAGTLSGAPKHKALQLIDQYENNNRAYYGGAIGFIGFNGDFNHAIMIRTFLSKDNQLTYQAGAGVVAKSDVPSELQEVHNKLEALRKAMNYAEKIEG
ncbi:MAG: anthranilate synthase component I family protein [Bacteroidota bacterium]